MEQTSLLAYAEHQHEKARLRQLVYAVIFNDSPICDKEIAERLKLPGRQSVAPRRNELVKRQFVKKVGTDVYQGRTVNIWGLV